MLVINPDRASANALAQILEFEGFNVTTVRTLDEARKQIRDAQFDLIITEALDQKSIYAFDPTFIEGLKSVAGETSILLGSINPSTDCLLEEDYGIAGNASGLYGMHNLITS